MKIKTFISVIDEKYSTKVPIEVVEFLKLKAGDTLIWEIDIDSKTTAIKKKV